jgi:hypothetical protein
LGLKRGLAEDLVIAPYATVMALMVAPEAACLNLRRMAGAGFEGQYGFYEAIDYTGSRLPRGKSNVVVRSFMAHHQGMSLLSLTYLLLNRPMQRRFESDPYSRPPPCYSRKEFQPPGRFTRVTPSLPRCAPNWAATCLRGYCARRILRFRKFNYCRTAAIT